MTLTWEQSIGIDPTHLVEFTDGLGRQVKVNREIVDDLHSLLEQAAADDVAITIVSAYRSFERQLAIWNQKWLGHKPVYSRHGRSLNLLSLSDIERYKAICLWSAVPGLSRHHWGTDLDIFASDALAAGHEIELVPEEFDTTGPCGHLNQWMSKQLEQLGFFRPYRKFQQGVAEEPWHISHHTIAQHTLKEFDLVACKRYIEKSNIQGRSFLVAHLEHYYEHYFCNICGPSQ